MPGEAAKLLWDASRAADKVTAFVRGQTFDDYLRNDLLRSAVERQLEVIGEALAQLRRLDPVWAQRIPELHRIVGMRNVLVHGYASVDDALTWGVVEGHLPALRERLSVLLQALPPAS